MTPDQSRPKSLEKSPTIPTAGVVIMNQDNKVLLVKALSANPHFSGVYGLPAGSVSKGETLTQTIKRKVKMETGLDINEGDLYEFPDNAFEADIETKDGKKHFSLTTFRVKGFSGTLQSSEHEEPLWVDIDKLDELPLLPNTKIAILNALK